MSWFAISDDRHFDAAVRTRFSAISRANEASPTTTARRADRALIHSRIFRLSGTVRSVKMPGSRYREGVAG
jgi:hypothetical protein